MASGAADGDPMGAQHAGEILVGELAALIGIEDLGLALAQRLVSLPKSQIRR